MTPLGTILIVASVLLGAGLLAVLAWLASTVYLNRIERRLARRKGIYRALVAELAVRERALLEPEIRRLGTLLDLEALEAVLEEQARDTAERPAWLLDVYDRLGLVDKYVDRLRSARRWRERAFAAELLGRVGNAKAVPALLETVQATRTEDGDVREIALRALARIGDPRAVDALVASLASADGWLAPRLADILTRHGSLVIEPLLAVLQQPGRPLARAWAANVLGEVRAAPAFAALARGLDDLEDEVRAKSATALGRLDDQRAIPYLLEHLLTDPAPFVRARIATALGRFDDPEVIERLVRGLGDSAWWVRLRSIEALEQIGPRAEPSLLTALDDPNPEIRIRAAVGLERLGLPVTLVGRIVRGDGVPEATETLGRFAAAGARELLAELLLHPALPVRAAVVAASRRSGRGDLAPELAERARRDPEPTLRAAAFDALAAIGAHDAAGPALEALGDEDDRVRAAAIRLLVGLGGPEIVVRLRNRAAAPEPVTRAAAVRALGRLGTLDAKPDFLRLMSDEHPEVREAAALAAGEARITALAPRLIGLLDDASAEVRLAAARGLGQVGDATALEPLAGAFAAADSALRDAIVSAVQRLDPGSVGGLLTTMAEGGDAAAKLSALRTFGRLRSAPVDAVERLARDPDPMVRAAAFEAVPRVRRAVPDDLIAAGLQDADEEVRAATLDAACRIELVSPAVILALLERDLSAHVRQRAALAAGLLRVEGGEAALRATCDRPDAVAVRAAAVLAIGAFDQESLIARLAEMAEADEVRAYLQRRLGDDPRYRWLRRRLSRAGRLELRALAAGDADRAAGLLGEGLRESRSQAERIRMVSGLRALEGDRARALLLQVLRGDPIADVRMAALVALGSLVDADELLVAAQGALRDPSLLVRRTAVGLFGKVPPERGLPVLLQALRADDDPAVLASAAELAETAFPVFADLARNATPGTPDAVLVAQVARYVHHPELPQLLPALARSDTPAVREAVASLWHHRPDVVDTAALEPLATDPVVAVRREAAAAAAGAGFWGLLDRMADDPDTDVRRTVALALGGAVRPTAVALDTLSRLAEDQEMPVRAAAYVGRLLQGTPVPLPPGLDPGAAAGAVRTAARLPLLRETARTAPGDDHRLAAALALALVDDDVARLVARTDPVPSIRYRVSGALDLATAGRAP